MRRLIAGERQTGELPRRLSEVRAYYTRLLPAGIPPHFEEQITWAEAHNELFDRLITADIFPLDAKPIFGEMMTIVEYLRQDDPYVQKAEHGPIRRDYHCRNLIGNSGFSPVLFRGNHDYVARISQTRPELIPFLRPNTKGGLQQRGISIHDERQFLANKTPVSVRRLQRPGIFIDFQVEQALRETNPPRDVYRVVWQKFTTPEEAIEHFLNEGEIAQFVRNNPQESLFKIARDVARMSFSEKVRILNRSVEYSFSPEKFAVSVSGKVLDYVDRTCAHQTYVRIETQRLTKAKQNFMYMQENEYSIPLVINPSEIREICLNYQASETHKTRIFLDWSPDFTRVQITIRGPEGKRTLEYRYDARKRRYLVVS